MYHHIMLHYCMPFFALALMSLVSAQAQQPFWRNTKGPYGGGLTALAIDGEGGRMYVSGYTGQHSGIFRSDNLGDEWNAVATTEAMEPALRLFCDRKGNFYVAAGNGNLYRTSDQGATWISAAVEGGGTPYFGFYDLVTMPNGVLFGATTKGLYHSDDHGRTWTQIDNVYAGRRIYSLTVDSTGALYAGSDSPLMRSTDNGRNWESVAPMFVASQWKDLLVTHSGAILGRSQNIYRFTYADSTWRLQASAPDIMGFGTLILAPNGDILAMPRHDGQSTEKKPWRSTDDGITWKREADDFPWYATAAGYIGNWLYATTGGGVLRSSDNGHHWEAANRSLAALSIATLGVTRGGTILAGSRGDLQRSTDDGETWTPSTDSIWNANIPGPFYSSPFLASCADGSIVASLAPKLVRSTDDGVRWNVVPGTETMGSVKSFAVAAGGALYAGADSGLYRSTDNGQTWSVVTKLLGPISSVAVEPGGRIFVVAGNIFGHDSLFRSVDNGVTWSKVYEGDRLYKVVATSYGRVAVGINTAGSNVPVFISDDFGNTWYDTRFSYFVSFALDSAENILACTQDDGRDNGPFLLRRASNTWESIASGLDHKTCAWIVPSPRGYLVAATSAGVYRSTTLSASDVENRSERRTTELTAIPNPSSGDLHLRFTMQTSGFVSLDLVDILGRPVRRVLNEWKEAGEYDVEMGIEGLPAGIYRCVLTGAVERTSASIVITR